ncbi:flagellin [Vibrio tritonius]|uniref:Flagellin n=1 Tax=Vibrio tritonius TaxID=1435069 RepID=A0ABS7YGS6_9VIBR|nr:flagellin [Vibrio tritonius]MCA2014873.1 flagellin [Vibrio tritonius]
MTISIRTNVAALNAQNYLGKTSQSQQSSMNRLASGSKINSATDDAAGLQLSNRLTAQSRGLDMAVQNANNGISVAQTAEGSMKETSQLLQRMRDLALQSSNGVNTDDDRDTIQQEVSSINEEINRIADTTSFAGKMLLNGTYGTKSFQIGNEGGAAVHLHLSSMRSDDKMMGGKTMQAQTAADASWKVSSEKNQLQLGFTTKNGEQKSIEINAKAGDNIEELATYINGQTDKVQASVDQKGHLQLFAGNSKVHGELSVSGSLADELNFAEAKETTVDEIDVSSVGGSQQAIGVIDSALKYVDNQRSYLGALQNRFEHAISNLDKVNENIAASNGRIMDTDYAKETTEMTKSQIMSQASSSILAQAKQLPQAALSLLG